MSELSEGPGATKQRDISLGIALAIAAIAAIAAIGALQGLISLGVCLLIVLGGLSTELFRVAMIATMVAGLGAKGLVLRYLVVRGPRRMERSSSAVWPVLFAVIGGVSALVGLATGGLGALLVARLGGITTLAAFTASRALVSAIDYLGYWALLIAALLYAANRGRRPLP